MFDLLIRGLLLLLCPKRSCQYDGKMKPAKYINDSPEPVDVNKLQPKKNDKWHAPEAGVILRSDCSPEDLRYNFHVDDSRMDMDGPSLYTMYSEGLFAADPSHEDHNAHIHVTCACMELCQHSKKNASLLKRMKQRTTTIQMCR